MDFFEGPTADANDLIDNNHNGVVDDMKIFSGIASPFGSVGDDPRVFCLRALLDQIANDETGPPVG